MEKIKYEITEIKAEVENTGILEKLNAIKNLIGNEMDSLEEYKATLDAKNDVAGSLLAKQNIQYNYILLSVINAIYNDVEQMNDEITEHHDNAMEEIKKALSDVNSLATKSDNA